MNIFTTVTTPISIIFIHAPSHHNCLFDVLRHLVYCIYDLLLEFLIPELPEEDFQRSLLQTLSRNPEKLLP